jgi:gamma-glutamylcyclotransferase
MTMPEAMDESARLHAKDVPWTQTERFYFAYGSNMNRNQLRSRGVRPLSAAVAKLPDHRISFHGYSRTWDGAVETVVSAPGQEVWGVIYKLTFSDGDTLDSWQDVRLDGTGAYFLCPARVIDTEGRTHPVVLYKKDVLGTPEKPSQEYLDFIIQGALEHGLPSAYIEGLRQMESEKAEYEVPRIGKLGSQLVLVTHCSECADALAPKKDPPS